ncbi:hypothetical protein [Actinoplanes sp. RD1]|uniref:hypothetical protein n=1 Tax=Actinoplanes sp. RD1 TaxID=3064538 RepID=UPI002741FC72|nr:hypothetical protein [Actinoplanes sp. RD1]
MSTVEELRRSMELRAGTATTDAGLAARVEARAGRIRRRRRVAAVAVSACLVLVVAVVVPQVVTRLRATPPAPPAIQPSREPGTLTVRPAAGSALVWSRGIDGTMQWMIPTEQAGKRGKVLVRVFDPGTYDATALQRGERITVGGHAAYRAMTPVDVYTLTDTGYDPTPRVVEADTVGWQDPSGPWVTVIDRNAGQGPGSADIGPVLLAAAADVRLGAPEDVLVPMHFPAIPDGLPITFAGADEAGPRATLRFGGDPAPKFGLAVVTGMIVDEDLLVTAWSTTSVNWTELIHEPLDTTVAGHPARYTETGEGSKLLVDTGSCGIDIIVRDRRAITRAELEAMVAGATFDACDSTATWTRPVN